MSKKYIFASRSAMESDPLTRRVLMAVRSREEKGRAFSILCSDSDVTGIETQILKAPRWKLLSHLNYFFFQSFFFLQKKRMNESFTTISACPTSLGADVLLVNFSQRAFLENVKASPDLNFRERLKLARVAWISLQEAFLYRFGRARLVLCNSPGLTEEIKSRCKEGTVVRYFPNLINGARYSPQVRLELRADARARFSYKKEDFVFSFLSYGHHLRKGFFTAVRILSHLNEDRQKKGERGVKFLVIGGEDSTIARLKQTLKKIAPDFESWVIFSGQTREPELLLAASDAFIFPSYFDSTPNAVIEAGALGLPLFLSDFYGSEVLLQEGINGRFISHDPDNAAQTISRYLEAKEFQHSKPIQPKLHSEYSWAEEFFEYLEEVEAG